MLREIVSVLFVVVEVLSIIYVLSSIIMNGVISWKCLSNNVKINITVAKKEEK